MLSGSLISVKVFVCVQFSDPRQLVVRDRTGRYGDIFVCSTFLCCSGLRDAFLLNLVVLGPG